MQRAAIADPREPRELEVFEPLEMTDDFITGIHAIEIMDGGCLRFTFYVLRRMDGQVVRQLLPRTIVIEGQNLPFAIKQASFAAVQWAKRAALRVANKLLH